MPINLLVRPPPRAVEMLTGVRSGHGPHFGQALTRARFRFLIFARPHLGHVATDGKLSGPAFAAMPHG